MKVIRRFLKQERGSSALEYALIVAGVAGLLFTTVSYFNTKLKELLMTIASHLW